MPLKPCLIFYFSRQLDEVSQLLLGQRTGNTTQLGAGSEDCRTQFTAEHIKTEDRLSPWLLENSSVETPRAAVALFQTDEENERLKRRIFYPGYIHTVQLPSPFSQIPAA